MHVSISLSSHSHQATSAPAKKCWPKIAQVVLSRQPPAPSRAPEMSYSSKWDVATFWYVMNVQRCNSDTPLIRARAKLSSHMVDVVTNYDRSTDTLPASLSPRLKFQRTHARTLPCHQTRQKEKPPACMRFSFPSSLSLSLTPNTKEPRIPLLAYREFQQKSQRASS